MNNSDIINKIHEDSHICAISIWNNWKHSYSENISINEYLDEVTAEIHKVFETKLIEEIQDLCKDTK